MGTSNFGLWFCAKKKIDKEYIFKESIDKGYFMKTEK